MGTLTLYHGSPEIVRKPEYGKGRPYNDYGRGFYCTESLDLAKEWACGENADGFVNRYEIDTMGLKTLNLSTDGYTVLHWLAMLMKHRRARVSTPLMKRGVEWLLAHYLPDVEGCDAIIGYRADDSYFSFARTFIGNEISLSQLRYAMRLGELGEQFVLKSERAFATIRFVASEEAPAAVYFPKRQRRDAAARAAFRAELERDDLDGLFIRDILRGRILPDDPRLR